MLEQMSIEDRNQMVRQYLPMVWKIAYRMHRYWKGVRRIGSVEDVAQVGAIGLIRAVELYRPQEGVKFITYATHCVQRCIGRAAMQDGLIPVPCYHQGSAGAPSVKASVEKEAQQALCWGTLPAGFDRIDPRSREWLEEESRSQELKELHCRLKQADESDRRLLALRYGLDGERPHMLRERGEMDGVSPEGVRRCRILRAEARLRQQMEAA